MSTNHCARTFVLWVCACASRLWFVHLPNWHLPLHLPLLQIPGMYAVGNFQRLIFGNIQSPNKFTGKPKIVSLPTSSQESVKEKSMFMFTFTLRTIYEVNGTAWYLKCCWPATYNNAIFAALLQHEEDNLETDGWKQVEKISQQIRSEQMVDQISSGIIGGHCHL